MKCSQQVVIGGGGVGEDEVFVLLAVEVEIFGV